MRGDGEAGELLEWREMSNTAKLPADYNPYDVEGAKRRVALRALLRKIGVEIPPHNHYNEQALQALYKRKTGITLDDGTLLRFYAERWSQNKECAK